MLLETKIQEALYINGINRLRTDKFFSFVNVFDFLIESAVIGNNETCNIRTKILITYLDKLQSVLNIEIPDSVVPLLLLLALENTLDSNGFIDADDDSGGVEHAEHEDGGDEDQGVIGIKFLMLQSHLHIFCYKSLKIILIFINTYAYTALGQYIDLGQYICVFVQS